MGGFRRMAMGLSLGAAVCALPAAIGWAGGPPGSGDADPHEVPAIFAKVSLAEAKAKARGNGKLVVADFTAEWCQPCKLMDRTTWGDPKVVEWLKANAIAVQIDVDKSRDVAKELHVSAMPTVMVFRGEEMVERRLGYQTGAQLLGMLESVKSPKKVDGLEAAVLPAPERKAPDPDKMSMQERLHAARELADNGKLDDATREYLWLWSNMLKKQPSMVGVRGSFMASDMQRLAQQHKPAARAFADERNRIEARLKTEDRTFEDLDDWIVLNGVIGDEKATLAWFDRVKTDADIAPTFRRVGFRLKGVLEAKQRWGDLGRLEADPMGAVRRAHDMWANMPVMPNADAELRKHMAEVHAQSFRKEAAMLYVAQLACGKADKAAEVLDLAVKLDASGAMRAALVEKAVDAHQATRGMIDELKRAEKDGADVKALRIRLVSELGEGAG